MTTNYSILKSRLEAEQKRLTEELGETSGSGKKDKRTTDWRGPRFT